MSAESKILGCGCLTVLIWCALGIGIGFVVDRTSLCKYVAKAFGVYNREEPASNGPSTNTVVVAEHSSQERPSGSRDAVLREFALRESPGIWQSVETMDGAIAAQEKKISRLRQELVAAHVNPEADADFRSLEENLLTMKRKASMVRDGLRRAYIAAAKYEAYWGKAEKESFRARLRNEGVSELDQIRARYEEMIRTKREGRPE